MTHCTGMRKSALGSSSICTDSRQPSRLGPWYQGAALLRPGGLLFTFSCSGAIDLPLFQKITADAVLDAGRSGQILHYMHQAADHPVGLPFPESLYLKGLVCRID